MQAGSFFFYAEYYPVIYSWQLRRLPDGICRLSHVVIIHRCYDGGDLEEEDGREAEAEFGVLGFMMPCFVNIIQEERGYVNSREVKQYGI